MKLRSSVPRCVVSITSIALVLLVGGCGGTPDGAGGAMPSATISSAVPSVAGSGSTGEPELGPTSVRVLTVSPAHEGMVQLGVVGPAGVTYRLRTGGKTVAVCGQVKGALDAVAPTGLAPNAVRHYQLSCAVEGGARTGALLVQFVGATFTYDFEVPVTLVG